MKQTIDILNKKISIFSSIKDLEPLTITLFNILNRFRKGYYENHIRKVRNPPLMGHQGTPVGISL